MKAAGTVPLVATVNVINAKLVRRGSAVKWSAVFRVASRDRYLVRQLLEWVPVCR